MEAHIYDVASSAAPIEIITERIIKVTCVYLNGSKSIRSENHIIDQHANGISDSMVVIENEMFDELPQKHHYAKHVLNRIIANDNTQQIQTFNNESQSYVQDYDEFVKINDDCPHLCNYSVDPTKTCKYDAKSCPDVHVILQDRLRAQKLFMRQKLLNNKHPMVSICKYYLNTGVCKRINCHFAHLRAEL
jgi:hypothetical protein